MKYKIQSLQTIKAFLSYLGCIAISLGVMYYLNGTVGILLTTALSCAFVLSITVTFIIMRSIKIELSLDKQSLSKEESLMCIINLSKKTIFPAPVIELHINCTPHLSKEIDICRVSLAGKEINTLTIPITAKYSGSAKINICNVFISDYLGIFHFKLNNIPAEFTVQLPIYPSIPNVPVQAEFLKSAVLFSPNDDDDEETNESAMIQTGMPGYDHREYYPGDPIKRINWKLSSKRDIYMIRLDEKTTSAGQVFFLDAPPLPDNDFTLSVRDTVIESMLSIFVMLIREGLETTFFFQQKGTWQKYTVHNSTDIDTLQKILANFEPSSISNIIPPEITGTKKTSICFTTATADFPRSAMQIVSEIPDILLISSDSAKLPKLTSEMWNLSDELELKKLRS